MERRKNRLYCITEVGGMLESIPASEVLHIEGITLDGLAGESIIRMFREDFEKALAAKKFSSRFFKNGMSAGGFLQAPPNAKPEAIRKVQQKVDQHMSGPDNAFKTIVLRDGFRWHSTQVDPRNGQLTETHEEDARNIARIYNISPSRLGLKNSTSYNSEEMARRDYYDGALSHWCHAISSEFTTKLLTREERDAGMYIEHNINALLWADAKTRSEIAIAGIQNGRFSPNETRGWENLDGYEGGDEFYVPLNMTSATESTDDPTPKNEETVRSMLHDVSRVAIAKAINRMSIKADRMKANPITEDRSTLHEMLSEVLNRIDSSHDHASDLLNSLANVSHEELRARAEEETEKLLTKLLRAK
jgi:HK97 family phage portal protein